MNTGLAANPPRAPRRIRLRELIAADLAANTGRAGLRAALSAAVFDPAFGTLLMHRLAGALRQAGLLRTARLLWRLNVAASSCHLHPDAVLGAGLTLPHPSGIVVGRGSRIGESVTLYQHVTLGRNLRDERYPVIGDGVVIYAGAVVAGGVAVGARAVIGAGAIVVDDVPEDAVVGGNPARVLRMQGPRR